uniref:inositol-tetrakisphosphate 1-kinase 1-like n=1 Tax=Erigeron canadensis TaxID=72917 RepID=UPI001CB932BE|nr:inositol-tetrakisphosphate 1-kinase 1-like [Erigeron canadensis]
MAESITPDRDRYIVGYALSTRKLSSFMTPHLINHAKHHAAIDFVKIDTSKPLTQQSPFHCILHKIKTNEWKLNLHDYTLKNPTTIIIDPPSKIERLHNRISMLEFIPNQLKIPNLNIPNQHIVEDSSTLSIINPELKFPVIAKPLVADGSTNSHNMSLVLNQQGLTKLDIEFPVVLQQFVNHGGVIFKVYVAGDYVKCVVRGSLADISDEMRKKMSLESEGVLCFSQISNSAMASDAVEMPATEFVANVAKRMREVLGLRLFNFDMVRDCHNGSGYLVIDINYFPGYEKLPSYETVITDFLLDVLKSQ